MKISLHKESHLDHDGVTDAHVALALGLDPTEHADGPFYVFSVTMPDELGALPCGLYGPACGDAPVKDSDVEMIVREGRKGASRLLLSGAARPSRVMTIVAGPHPKDPSVGLILHTIYGGPVAPQEPTDPYLAEENRPASVSFWGEHGLVR